ncbi:MAG: translation initiation factor IF-2 [Balneolaceae bacterium]|nr:MAG: translation initiation factor IF-2 [Balneolaceae bacterium]
MSEGKPKRLFKVASEFNVSTQSIVEALAEKDFKIDNKPNSRITPEMYAVLETIYGEDKARNIDHEKAREQYEEKRSTIKSSRQETVSIDSFLQPIDDTPKKEKPSAPPVSDSPGLEPLDEPAKKERPAETEIEPAEKKADVTPEKSTEPAARPEKEERKPAAESPPKKPEADSAPEETKEPEPVTGMDTDEVTDSDESDEDAVEGIDIPLDSSVIRARSERLKGTRILGRISIEKDVPAGGEAPGKGRKKRKKKVAGKPDETPEVPGAVKKPVVKTPVKTDSDTEDDDAKNKKKKKRIKGKKGAPKTVDPTAVDTKMRETLAMLSSGTGKKRQKRRRQKREEMAEERERQAELAEQDSSVLEVSEFITVSDLADLLDVPPTSVITACMGLGLMVSINQRLEANTIELIAAEFDRDVRFVDAEEMTEDLIEDTDDEKDLKPRAPIVTVMGHVDHGKTSLLDYIRHTKVVDREAGGITQHIGAYLVKLDDGREISFLDTPGHEAFTAMRARGAQVTDIVILVVAADDSVMRQTVEAINHAKAAGVSIVVAINKIDKPDSKPERIMQQLADHNVLVEDWGGKIQCGLVSAKTGSGIDELLDKVLIEAELMELKANPGRNAAGIVLESRVDKGKGVVVNLLVQKGTMKVGDTFVAGHHYGRVRAMENEFGHRIDTAGPSTPIQVTGFDGTPQAGDKLMVTDDEKTAKDIAFKRQQIKREQDLRKVKHMTLDDLSRRLSLGDVSELNIIIKGDVDGSIEALSGSLQKLSTEEVKVVIIHTGVGAITESDVLLASASDAIIIGFQVRPSTAARKLAEREQIDIRLFSVIYEAVDVVHDALEGLLSPEISEKITSTVEVRETFKVPGAGTIAGCYVTDGKINRNMKVRLIRDGIVIFTGEISSLKRFKDDVREVASGYECGIGIHNFNDIKVGDVIESFELVETKRKLTIESN